MNGLLQRIQREARVGRSAHPPTNDPAGIGIDDKRNVDEVGPSELRESCTFCRRLLLVSPIGLIIGGHRIGASICCTSCCSETPNFKSLTNSANMSGNPSISSTELTRNSRNASCNAHPCPQSPADCRWRRRRRSAHQQTQADLAECSDQWWDRSGGARCSGGRFQAGSIGRGSACRAWPNPQSSASHLQLNTSILVLTGNTRLRFLTFLYGTSSARQRSMHC